MRKQVGSYSRDKKCTTRHSKMTPLTQRLTGIFIFSPKKIEEIKINLFLQWICTLGHNISTFQWNVSNCFMFQCNISMKIFNVLAQI